MDNETIFWYNMLCIIGNNLVNDNEKDDDIKKIFRAYWILNML
jgi:hypothetical protein